MAGAATAPVLAPITVGAIPYGQIADDESQANLFENLGQTAAQLPQQKLQMQQQKMQMQDWIQQQRQSQLQTEAMEQTTAQAGWDTLSKMTLANPQYAKDPQVIARMQKYGDALGVPVPLLPDGSIDVDTFKTPFAQIDTKDLEFGATLPPAQRAAYFKARYSAVPDSVLQQQAFISPKDQANIARAVAYGVRQSVLDAATTSRTQFENELDQAKTAGDWATVFSMKQKMANETTNAQAHMTEANAAASSASTRLGELNLKILQYNANPNIAGQKLMGDNAKALELEGSKLNDQIVKMRSAIATATAGNVDSDTVANMNSTLAGLIKQHDTIAPLVAKAQQIQAENLGYSHSIQGASGKTNTVTDVGKKQPPFNVPAGWTAGQDADGHWYIQQGATKKYWQGQ